MDLISKALQYQSVVNRCILRLDGHRGAKTLAAKSLGISTDTLKKYLRLLDLPSEVQANVTSGKIKLFEALLIQRLPDERQVEIAEYYINRKIGRSRLTEIVNDIIDGRTEKLTLNQVDINIKKELERLIEHLGFFIDESLTDDTIMVIKTWDEDIVKHLFLVKSSVDSIDYNLDISIPQQNMLSKNGIRITFKLPGLPGKDDLAKLACMLFKRIETLREKINKKSD